MFMYLEKKTNSNENSYLKYFILWMYSVSLR